MYAEKPSKERKKKAEEHPFDFVSSFLGSREGKSLVNTIHLLYLTIDHIYLSNKGLSFSVGALLDLGLLIVVIRRRGRMLFLLFEHWLLVIFSMLWTGCCLLKDKRKSIQVLKRNLVYSTLQMKFSNKHQEK